MNFENQKKTAWQLARMIAEGRVPSSYEEVCQACVEIFKDEICDTCFNLVCACPGHSWIDEWKDLRASGKNVVLYELCNSPGSFFLGVSPLPEDDDVHSYAPFIYQEEPTKNLDRRGFLFEGRWVVPRVRVAKD